MFKDINKRREYHKLWIKNYRRKYPLLEKQKSKKYREDVKKNRPEEYQRRLRWIRTYNKLLTKQQKKRKKEKARIYFKIYYKKNFKQIAKRRKEIRIQNKLNELHRGTGIPSDGRESGSMGDKA